VSARLIGAVVLGVILAVVLLHLLGVNL